MLRIQRRIQIRGFGTRFSAQKKPLTASISCSKIKHPLSFFFFLFFFKKLLQLFFYLKQNSNRFFFTQSLKRHKNKNKKHDKNKNKNETKTQTRTQQDVNKKTNNRARTKTRKQQDANKYGALQRQRQHTYTQDIHNSKSVIEGKLVHLRKKIIVIITRPIQPKSNKEEKRQRQRQPRHGHHRLAPQQPAFDHQPPSSHQSPPHQATHPHSHP